MDDRGRLAQPPKGTARWRSRLVDSTAVRAGPPGAGTAMSARPGVTRIMDRWSSLLNSRWPRGVGVVATAAIVLASLAYGMVKGDDVPRIVSGVKGARDGIASA